MYVSNYVLPDFAGFYQLGSLEGNVVAESVLADNSLNSCFAVCESTADAGLAVVVLDRCICMEVV